MVSDETKECVIIDCGALYDDEGAAITSYIQTSGLAPKHLLCTHGHFDHCMGNGIIYNAYGLKPEVHIDDEFLMIKMREQTREILGVNLPMEVPPVGKYLSDNDLITFGSHTLTILHTPGHTPGGVCYYCKRRVPPKELTMDHIVPIIRGGFTRKGNVVPCCKECNNKKKYMLPIEWQEYMDSLK